MIPSLRVPIWGLSIVLAAVALAQSGPAGAQKPPPRFKQGDRVEIDVIMASSPQRAVWKKGTVTAVNAESGLYTVAIDTPTGRPPQSTAIPIRSQDQWMRDVQGPDSGPPQTLTQKKNESAHGTVLADRGFLDCDVKQPAAKNGPPPPPELARTLIRCLFERAAQPGMDGAVTVDLGEFQIGTSRKWVPRSDLGSGNVNTVIHPVRAAWTRKTWYRTNTVAQTNESVFNCFVNAFDKWECGVGQRIKDGEVKYIQVK